MCVILLAHRVTFAHDLPRATFKSALRYGEIAFRWNESVRGGTVSFLPALVLRPCSSRGFIAFIRHISWQRPSFLIMGVMARYQRSFNLHLNFCCSALGHPSLSEFIPVVHFAISFICCFSLSSMSTHTLFSWLEMMGTSIVCSNQEDPRLLIRVHLPPTLPP